MKINYEIFPEDRKIVLDRAPDHDLEDGLVITYGQPIPLDTGIVHYAAITHDVYKGCKEYMIPSPGVVEGFSPDTIHEVELKDECLDIVRR